VSLAGVAFEGFGGIILAVNGNSQPLQSAAVQATQTALEDAVHLPDGAPSPLSTTFPMPIAQVGSESNLQAIGKALLCFLAAFAWVGLVAIGIKLHITDRVSIPIGWFPISPSLGLIATGMFFLVRGVFVGRP
jgi:hypothetical protein